MQEQVEFGFMKKNQIEKKESRRKLMMKYLEAKDLIVESGIVMKVGTNKDRGERDSAYYKKFPDDEKFWMYKELTSIEDGAQIMIPYAEDREKEGYQFVYYAPNGINAKGKATGVLKVKLTDEEFLQIWNTL